MRPYILSIDQGTTSTRAILFDHNGTPINSASRDVICLFPHSGWVEADALAIWISVIDVVNEALVKANVTWDDIDSIGITNQRETAVVWDKKTGMPIYNAIVWQSRQSAEICDRLMDHKEEIQDKTGLLINPYFSASKVRFIFDQVPGSQQRAEKGELLFGTIDSWLIYKMSRGKVHATDVSNASRTLLFNIHTLSWDDDLLTLFHLPKAILPEVKESSSDYGPASFFSNDVHIRGVAGDQQAALFGHTCFEKGESKNTYGTGCFMLLNTGNEVISSKRGLISTVAWSINGQVTYALEGSVFIGGAVIQWLRDQLKMIHSAEESEAKAMACHYTHGVYVVPAFTGLGAPYWDDDARGAVFGLTRNTNDNHFTRACLEAIAYQCKDVFEVFKKDANCSIKTLRVDGGATANKYLMQFQSDILSTEITLPRCLQTTALGVAYLAGLNSGFYANLDEIKKIHQYQATFSPKLAKKEVNTLYKGWKLAVKATRVFK